MGNGYHHMLYSQGVTKSTVGRKKLNDTYHTNPLPPPRLTPTITVFNHEPLNTSTITIVIIIITTHSFHITSTCLFWPKGSFCLNLTEPSSYGLSAPAPQGRGDEVEGGVRWRGGGNVILLFYRHRWPFVLQFTGKKIIWCWTITTPNRGERLCTYILHVHTQNQILLGPYDEDMGFSLPLL